MLDLRLWNHHQMRTAVAPAANGHFTAEALASFYERAFLAGADSLLPQSVADDCFAARTEETALAQLAAAALGGMDLKIHFGLGFQVFGKRDADGAMRWTGLGHFGVGGALALCDLESGLAVAVTLNQVNIEAAPTRRLLDAVFEHFEADPFLLW